MDIGMLGPALSLGLSAVGASVGCAIAGMMSHGLMSRIEESHGKFIGLSAVPASQMMYGFILMLRLKTAIAEGQIQALSAGWIGGLGGLAIMFAAIYQGLCCATAMQAVAKQPSLMGKSFVAIGVIESFALFAMVFSLLLI